MCFVGADVQGEGAKTSSLPFVWMEGQGAQDQDRACCASRSYFGSPSTHPGASSRASLPPALG